MTCIWDRNEVSAVTAANQTYLHAGSPVTLDISWELIDPDTEIRNWSFRFINYRGEVLSTEQYFPYLRDRSAESSGTFEFLTRIPRSLKARSIKLQIAAWDFKSKPITLLNGSGVAKKWVTLLETTVLLNWEDPNFCIGWFPPEVDEAGELWWWTQRTGRIRLPVNQKPIFLWIKGSTPIRCFETNPIIEVTDHERISKVITVETPQFEFFTVLPGKPWRRTQQDMVFTLSSDSSFLPKICHGNDDQRELSFKISEFTLKEFIPLEGFSLGSDDDGNSWIEPAATFLIPNYKRAVQLLIKGKIAHSCMADGQTISINHNQKLLAKKKIESRDFCWFVPIPGMPNIENSFLKLTIVSEPFYFPSVCSDSDDSRPHGFCLADMLVM